MPFAITFVLFHQLRAVPAANKQLERTVIRRHVRAASASFHCAHAAAGRVVVRPLNCSVGRQEVVLAVSK